MEKGYIGWIVEWGDLGSRKRGIVVQETDCGTIVIFDENGTDTVEVSIETRLVKIKPADISDVKLQKNIRKGLQKWKQDDPDTHDIFLAILTGLEERGLNSVKVLAKSASNEKLQISARPKRVPSGGKGRVKSGENGGIDEESANDEDTEDDDELDEDSQEGEEEEYEEDESWDDEDMSSDEEESSENDGEDEEESSDEDDSSDDEDLVDLKVYIALPGQTDKAPEVRGFSIVRRHVLHRIVKTILADYGLAPRLFYRDQEGDDVLLRHHSDLKYALKSHEQSSQAESKLRLYARFDEDTVGGTSSSVARHSVNRALSSDTLAEALVARGLSKEGAPAWAVDSPEPSQFSTTINSSSGKVLDSALAAVGIGSGGEFLWQRGELIGCGSFGQVFGGIHLDSGRRIAVKEVHLSATRGHLEQARALQTEIKVLSELEHPNIIKYHGAECTKDTLRIFLDLASEGSMKDVINEFGALSEPLLRRYTADMLCGLAFLHSKGYIHRDIKPSNLLLDKNMVKLADFGCTGTVVLSNDGLHSEPHHDTVIGTTIYMSPEVMRGGENPLEDGDPVGYGRKADIWSVGITVVEMGTAHPPFRNAAAAIYAVCVSKELPTLPATMSAEAHQFVARCLVDDARQRADCQELTVHPFVKPLPSTETRLKTPAHERHTSSTLQLNPDFDLMSFSVTEVAALTISEETDGDDEDTFFKSRKKSIGATSRRDGSTLTRRFDDVDMNDATMER